MPRPNPPRKRPRRRNPNVVKVPQQAHEQTAPEQKQAAAPPPQRSARAAVKGSTPTPVFDTSEWPRRSLYVLIGAMAVAWVVIRLLTYTFSKSAASISLYLLFLEPFTLVAAGFVAMPIAKRITRERRYLRIVETAMIGVFVFFLSIFFNAGSAPLLQASGNIIPAASSKAVPTPCVSNCSTVPTASPSATATSSSSRPSASASPAPVPVTVKEDVSSYTIIGGVDVLAFALTPLIFYPIYRRLRFKPRTPPAPRDRRGKTDAKR